MKKSLFVLIALAVTSASAFASQQVLWDCSGGSLEGLHISVVDGRLEGSVSWDCFPGDGICTQTTEVAKSSNSDGDLVFKGDYFELTIRTSVSSSDGNKARISAKDMTDSDDQGRGLTINQVVTCQKGSFN